MSDDVWDVAVVGAGPAGAVVARELVRIVKGGSISRHPHPRSVHADLDLPLKGGGEVGSRDIGCVPRKPDGLFTSSLEGEVDAGSEATAAGGGNNPPRRLRVLLLDQAHFPRRKVCGCCLNRNALAALESAGLGELPARLGAVPLTRVTLASSSRTASVALPGGVSLSREAFDTALVEEARQAGVTVQTGVKVRLDAIENAVWRLNAGNEAIRTKVVIDATGLNGRLTDADVTVRPGSRIGAGTIVEDRSGFFQPGSIYMATGHGGYVGLVRLEDGRLDIAAAFDAGFVREAGSLAVAAERTLSEAGFPVPLELPTAEWKGTPPLTRQPTRVAGPRWFAVGDASGYVEPFTGEGMAWAISGAVALAPIVSQAVNAWDDRFVRQWEAAHRSLVGRRQVGCRVVARVLRSPFACRWAVRGLQWFPTLAAPVVRGLNRPSQMEPRATVSG